MKELDNYFKEILIPILQSKEVEKNVIEKVTDDINQRFLSLISNWTNEEFRKTILFIGKEEAKFYKPKVLKDDIKAFVVVTIRNSLLEEIGSTEESAINIGLKKQINLDEIMLEITSTAATYFSNIIIEELSNKSPQTLNEHFVDLHEKYPVAWNAIKNLSNLSNTNKQDCFFTPINMPEIRINQLKKSKRKSLGETVVLSGMDQEFDLQLIEYFREIKNNPRSPFFTDSFKAITRNLDKLFLTIEFLLRIKSPVVTFNFYIENGYVAMRRNWVKPFHYSYQIKEKLVRDKFDDCVKKHKEALIDIRRQMISEIHF
jgi:hypothetical protein